MSAILPGSGRLPIPDALPAGAPDPSASISVTVMVRRREPDLPPPGTRLSRTDFAQRFGADPEDVQKVEEFAAFHKLTVGDVDLARRSIMVIGTVANMNEAFGTQLRLFQSPDGVFRGRTGVLSIPADLEQTIVGVFGLDERPQARPKLRRLFEVAGAPAVGDTSYTPDLSAYFTKIGIIPAPNVTAVSVDGALNQPVGDPNSADGEVLLDIEIVGAVAPGARIVVYFAPNTDQGFLDAITTAVHDQLRKPSVISISWGGAESTWTDQSLKAYDQAFHEAGLLGVSVCCASGDDGSTDGVADGASHVDFPASSPNVLSCGGTRLESTAGTATQEVVWNHGVGKGASGGGVSEKFPLPAYQSKAKVPVSVNPAHFKGRGVPDVSGDADPSTGYQIRVDGKDAIFGGTSAVAPLWAALIALLNQRLPHTVGFLHPALYGRGAGSGALKDIVIGDNGAFKAKKGWDACTGLGSPSGKALLTLLGGK